MIGQCLESALVQTALVGSLSGFLVRCFCIPVGYAAQRSSSFSCKELGFVFRIEGTESRAFSVAGISSCVSSIHWHLRASFVLLLSVFCIFFA